MWKAAIRAGADRVTITSYNEWHEGTQIEPAHDLAPATADERSRACDLTRQAALFEL